MLRKSALLAALAVTLAAGSAFAETSITGTVTRVDPAGGNVWLANGMEFGVGRTVASGVLPGNKMAIIYTNYDNSIAVVSASPVS